MFNLNTAFSQVNGSKTGDSIIHRDLQPDIIKDLTTIILSTIQPYVTCGSGGRMQIQKLNGHFFLLGAVSWKTPGFETNDLGYLREADQILSVVVAGYSQWEPKWIYRNYNINGDVYMVNNFGGNLTGKGFEWNASAELKNYWNIWTGGNLSGSSLSTGMLRGGPMMKLPGSTNARIGFSTDYRKKITFSVSANGSKGWENDSRNLYTGVDVSYKPTNYFHSR